MGGIHRFEIFWINLRLILRRWKCVIQITGNFNVIMTFDNTLNVGWNPFDYNLGIYPRIPRTFRVVISYN